jgi:hypothetical protein
LQQPDQLVEAGQRVARMRVHLRPRLIPQPRLAPGAQAQDHRDQAGRQQQDEQDQG